MSLFVTADTFRGVPRELIREDIRSLLVQADGIRERLKAVRRDLRSQLTDIDKRIHALVHAALSESTDTTEH